MIFNMVSGGGLSLESIAVTTPPAKTLYAPGDEFDTTGMVVTANLGAGVTFPLDEYTVTPTEITLGMTYVTIAGTVDGVTQTTTQAITVEDKTTIAYTGNMDSREITVDGTTYVLYTLTGSGTLSISGKAPSLDIWCCGGGANGQTGYGGGGGYFTQQLAKTLAAGSYTVTIGAAQGTTSIAQGDASIISAAGATNQNGGSGGGGYWYVSVPWGPSESRAPGTGVGTTTRPFGDSTNFTSLPCAGGGGSGWYDSYTDGEQWSEGKTNGGAGGWNGSGGSAGQNNGSGAGAAGGTTGGGQGGNGAGNNATAATYYGSGGGGASSSTRTHGAGYQGVLYFKIEKGELAS